MVNQPAGETQNQRHTNAGAQHDQELLFSGHAVYHLVPAIAGDKAEAKSRVSLTTLLWIFTRNTQVLQDIERWLVR